MVHTGDLVMCYMILELLASATQCLCYINRRYAKLCLQNSRLQYTVYKTMYKHHHHHCQRSWSSSPTVLRKSYQVCVLQDRAETKSQTMVMLQAYFPDNPMHRRVFGRH